MPGCGVGVDETLAAHPVNDLFGVLECISCSGGISSANLLDSSTKLTPLGTVPIPRRGGLTHALFG